MWSKDYIWLLFMDFGYYFFDWGRCEGFGDVIVGLMCFYDSVFGGKVFGFENLVLVVGELVIVYYECFGIMGELMGDGFYVVGVFVGDQGDCVGIIDFFEYFRDVVYDLLKVCGYVVQGVVGEDY